MDASSTLQEPPPLWFDASKQLPPEDEDVLGWWAATFPPMVCLWNGRSWQDSNGAMEDFDAPPTQWRAIGELPK
jgi:hypothetical protein